MAFSSKLAAVASSLALGLLPALVWAQAAPAPAPAPAATPAATVAATTAPTTKGTGSLPNGQPDFGERGAFVVDQVSGFRGRIGGGVSYYGPIGVAYNSFEGLSGVNVQLSPDGKSVNSIVQNQTTISSWSLWLAPSIDYFLVDGLSIGGLFSLEGGWGKQTTEVKDILKGTSSKSEPESVPTLFSFTIMPRIGYAIRVNDRLSLWPRVGVGYYHGSNATVQTGLDAATGKITSQTVTTGISSLLFQLDFGLVYQITDNVFFRVAPAVAFSTNGSSTIKYRTTVDKEDKGGGSAFQFEIASGFGANFSL